MARFTSDKEKAEIWRRAEARIMALGEAARTDPTLQREVRITFTGRDDDGRFNTRVSAEGPLWEAMQNCVLDVFLDFDPYPDRYLDEDVKTISNAFGLACLIMDAVGANGCDLRIRPRRTRRPARVSR